ncbi:MBOAT family O-acyltransferase [Afifella pfennigii]|uniref:MBOAT family O-acyltransferase n=1 Tax=Afifella pfennigii TaxID=209897 RepID=UPI00047AC906|nr:MBOAT family protein [Afifella pfennigii]
MLFQSQVFLLLFLPVVFGAFFLLARRMVAREWMLIVASAFFYGWWDARFLPLLFGQAVLSWLLVRFARPGFRFLLPLGIALNLGVLALFKYADFAVESLEALLGEPLPRSALILPIGISFYTFQIISYLADAQRGVAPRYGLRRFVLYVSFFPQLIAGPIVRHNEIMLQFDQDPLRPGLGERIGRGATLFVIGLLKKVFLADQLAPIADGAFAAATGGAPGLGDAWSGALAFSLQLFFDFSAYSDMAIGLAMVMGIRLPTNFDAPYRARNLQEFWRRWHITLSRFLRDYVYIPLGGSRHGTRRYVFAAMATMGLCGLWHGAGWTFVVWGLMHGAGLIVARGFGAVPVRLPYVVSWAITMGFVLIGWVLFRAVDFASATAMLAGLAGLGGAAPGEGWALIAVGAAIAVLGPASVTFAFEQLKPYRAVAALAAAGFVAAVLEVGEGAPVSFIYFQF